MSAIKPLPLLVLASQSPRRKQILETMGLTFRVLLPSSDEIHPDHSNLEVSILENARAKAESILDRLDLPENIAIGADTLVATEKRILGKPAGRDEAVAMLRELSGATHTVYTGLTLISPRLGRRERCVQSRVTFREMSAAEIESYVSTREPYDKAGSYAVQGLGAIFITAIDGSYTNVMGLPIEALLEELGSLSGRPVYDFF